MTMGPEIVQGLRPSDKERNAALGQLATAYGDGRIGKAEHDTRVAAIYDSSTKNDLEYVVSDLPPAVVSKKEIRKARLAGWRQRELASAQKSAGSLSWVRWQWGVVGMLTTGAAGLFLLCVGTVIFSLAKSDLPRVARDAGVGGCVFLGFLLLVLAIFEGAWLYDISEAKTGYREKRGGRRT